MKLDLKLHISSDDIAGEKLLDIVSQLSDIYSFDIAVCQLANHTDLVNVTFSTSECNDMNSDSLFSGVLTNLLIVRFSI